MGTSIEQRADFGIIRYANCWEDADVLCAALEPSPGKRILSIASAGDNALALLAEGCEVVAVDLSPAQLACVELRMEAFRQLKHPDLLAFLGVRNSSKRRATYQQLVGNLSTQSRGFWDQHIDAVENGVIFAGKFERYFRKFRRLMLPLIHSRRRVAELLEEKGAGERRTFYDQRWNTWRWRLLFRIFFSRFMMGRLGRDPEFFRYVEGSVADRILERTEYALTTLPTHQNPYLHFILNGNFGAALPRYLREEHFQATRDGLDRLTLFAGGVEDAARETNGKFDGFNLSDIFEYLDESTCESLYAQLLAAANTGARLAYWNMLAPRQRPERLADQVNQRTELADELFAKDLAFFYSRFVLEEVR